MPRIASLAIDFTTNVAQIANDMSRVRRSVEGTLQGIKTVAATAFATFIPLATINQALSFADNLAVLRQQTGFTAEALQKLKIAAGENTVDAEKFDGAIQKLTVSIGKAAEGSKSAQEAFARVGVSVNDLRTLSPEQIFTKMQDGFAAIPRVADRAAIATEIFGKAAGPGMAAFMAQGSAAIRAHGEDLERMGAIMDDNLVTRAGRAHDQLATLGSTMRAAFDTGFLSQIQDQFHLIGDSMERMTTTSHGAGETFGWLTSEVMSLGSNIMDVVGAVFDWAGGMETVKVSVLTVVNAIKLVFLNLQDVILTDVEIILIALQKIDHAYVTVMNKLGSDTQESQFLNEWLETLAASREAVQNQMADVILEQTEAWDKLAKVGEADDKGGRPAAQQMAKQLDILGTTAKNTAAHAATLKAETSKLADGQKTVAETARTVVGSGLPEHLDRVKGSVTSVRSETEKLDRVFVDVFESITRSALTGTLSLKSLGDEALRIVTQLASTPAVTNSIGGAVSGLFSGIGDIFSGLFGGFRASGGPVSAGKTYVVGERGPELLHMGASGTVTPNGAFGALTVNVFNNHPGAQISAQERTGPGGQRELILVIDEMMAAIAGNPSSMFSRAQSRLTGARPVLTPR